MEKKENGSLEKDYFYQQNNIACTQQIVHFW